MGWGLVQHKAGSGQSVSSLAVTFTSASTVGNRVLVGIAVNGNAVTVSSVTDNASGGSNSYHKDDSHAEGTGAANAELWSAQIARGGTLTVTVTLASSDNFGVIIAEDSGLNTSASPVDVHGEADTNGTASSATSATTSAATTAANELVVGFLATGSGDSPYTPTNGTSIVDSLDVSSVVGAVLVQKDSGSSGQTETAGVTLSAADIWSFVTVVYKLAAGGTQHNQTLSVATATVPTLVKRVGKGISVNTATSPSVTKQIGKGLSVTTATSPSVTKQIGKLVSVATATTPSVLKQISKTLGVATSTVPSVATTKIKLVLLSVATAVVPTIQRAITKALTVQTATAPSVTKQISKTLSVATATSPSVTKQIGKGLSVATATAVSLTAQLAVTVFAVLVKVADLAAFVASLGDSLAYSVAVSDAAAPTSVTISDLAAYAVAVGDSAAYTVAVSDQTP